jgi:hypothetical protein
MAWHRARVKYLVHATVTQSTAPPTCCSSMFDMHPPQPVADPHTSEPYARMLRRQQGGHGGPRPSVGQWCIATRGASPRGTPCHLARHHRQEQFPRSHPCPCTHRRFCSAAWLALQGSCGLCGHTAPACSPATQQPDRVRAAEVPCFALTQGQVPASTGCDQWGYWARQLLSNWNVMCGQITSSTISLPRSSAACEPTTPNLRKSKHVRATTPAGLSAAAP